MIAFTVKTVAHLAMLASVTASGTALAQFSTRPQPLDPAITVNFGELNLSSPEGARVLYGRIRTAAQRVCGPSFSIRDANRWAKWKVCYGESVDKAVKQVNRPLLTALHERRIGLASR